MCVQATAYERLWHLVVPPVMTLLDDYEVRYKLRGVQLVVEMLESVPLDLLRRTGVSGLLFTVRPLPFLPSFSPNPSLALVHSLSK